VLRLGPIEATLDAYRIDIDDRIVLSENLLDSNAEIAALLPDGVSGARFFINGVDTRTSGVDLVVRTRFSTLAGDLDLELLGNKSHTAVRKVPTTGVLSGLNNPPALFDRPNLLTFERGNPESKLAAALTWSLPGALDAWSLTLRGTRYGDVTEPGVRPAGSAERIDLRDLVIEARWLFDLELRAQLLGERMELALGADNLFDRYPLRTPIARANPPGLPIDLNATNALAFSRFSPFGFSGRFVYARLSYRW
jgi:iron complex outermembrane receptor protein